MKFIKELKEGDRVFDIYLCKHKQEAVTKNGKPYESVILQDKTGTIDAKVWEPNNPGIGDYDDLDYIEVYGDVTNCRCAFWSILFSSIIFCISSRFWRSLATYSLSLLRCAALRSA